MRMPLILSAAFLVFTSAAFAGAMEHAFVKRVTPHVLQEELLAAGFNVESIACSLKADGRDQCKILWAPGGETKNPAAVIAAHIYHDAATEGAAKRARLRKLADRIRGGSATNQERDEALAMMAEILAGDEGRPAPTKR